MSDIKNRILTLINKKLSYGDAAYPSSNTERAIFVKISSGSHFEKLKGILEKALVDFNTEIVYVKNPNGSLNGSGFWIYFWETKEELKEVITAKVAADLEGELLIQNEILKRKEELSKWVAEKSELFETMEA